MVPKWIGWQGPLAAARRREATTKPAADPYRRFPTTTSRCRCHNDLLRAAALSASPTRIADRSTVPAPRNGDRCTFLPERLEILSLEPSVHPAICRVNQWGGGSSNFRGLGAVRPRETRCDSQVVWSTALALARIPIMLVPTRSICVKTSWATSRSTRERSLEPTWSSRATGTTSDWSSPARRPSC
jgi:hypothetical protein